MPRMSAMEYADKWENGIKRSDKIEKYITRHALHPENKAQKEWQEAAMLVLRVGVETGDISPARAESLVQNLQEKRVEERTERLNKGVAAAKARQIIAAASLMSAAEVVCQVAKAIPGKGIEVAVKRALAANSVWRSFGKGRKASETSKGETR